MSATRTISIAMKHGGEEMERTVGTRILSDLLQGEEAISKKKIRQIFSKEKRPFQKKKSKKKIETAGKMVPRGLEPRTLWLLAIRSDQLSYETLLI